MDTTAGIGSAATRTNLKNIFVLLHGQTVSLALSRGTEMRGRVHVAGEDFVAIQMHDDSDAFNVIPFTAISTIVAVHGDRIPIAD